MVKGYAIRFGGDSIRILSLFPSAPYTLSCRLWAVFLRRKDVKLAGAELSVLKIGGLLSRVPRKLVVGLVPLLPVSSQGIVLSFSPNSGSRRFAQ
jgi:hypothetical protein